MPGIGSTRMTRRQLVGMLGLGAVTPFALSACSGPGAATGGGGGGGGHPTLSQWYHQYGEQGTEQAAKRYASSYSKATVNVNWVPGDYASKLNSRLLAGNGVDLFENNGVNVTDARAGRYADLTSVVEPIKSRFSDTALNNVTIDGKIYGIPMIIDPQAFYYNKAMFKDAGVSAPETMEDFVAVVEKLSSGGKKGVFLSNTDGGAGLSQTMAWATGTTIVNDAHDAAAFADVIDPLAQTYDYFQRIHSQGWGLQGQPSDWVDITPFADKKVPIQWCGMGAMPQAIKALGDDVGVFAMPASGSKGVPAVIGSNWNQQVAEKSQNRDAAIAFAKWLWVDQAKDQEDWALSYGFHIPPIISVAQGATKLQSGPAKDFLDLFTKYGKQGTPFVTPNIGQVMEDTGTKIIISGADATSQLKAAATKVTSDLKSLS